MKKIKILTIILTFSLLYKSLIFAEAKNLEQTKVKELKIEKEEENITNKLTKKEKEKFYVEDYIIKQIIKKGIFTIVHYEHKKSHAQFLVFFDNLKYINITPKFGEYSTGEFFIKCDPSVSFVTLTAFCDFLNESLQQRLNLYFSKEELFELGLFSRNYFQVLNGNESGYGLILYFKKCNKKLFKNIIDVLQHPEWIRFKKFLKLSLQQTKNNLEYYENIHKNIYGFNLEPKMFDRFYFGKYINYGNMKELDKLIKDEDFLYKTHNKIFNPSNFFIKLNGRQTPNYKKIMKKIHENKYFKFKDKEKIKKTNEKKLNNVTEKKPYREIELEINTKSKPAFLEYSKNDKYKARLFWDISKIPEKERSVFLTKTNIYEDFLKKEIKKMGYNSVKAIKDFYYPSEDYNAIIFDGLYYIDIFGSNKKYFTKEKLEENGQKLIKMLYEKIKNIKEEEILNSVYYDSDIKPEFEDDLNFSNSNKYNRKHFKDLYLKSYYLTNNPFNKKYFKFKNNREIEFKTKDLLETFKKYNKNFETLFNNKPNYIDLFIANKKNEKSENKFKYYFSPIYGSFEYNKKKSLKDSILASLNFETIYSKFYKPNLFDKNLVRKEAGDGETYFSIKPENLAKVEEYLFNKFKKEIKNYVPTKDEINKIKTKEIKNLNLKIKNNNVIIKECEEVLNNNEKFKLYLKTFKKRRIENNKRNIFWVKNLKKEIKKFENEKATTKQEKKDKMESIKHRKKILKSTKEHIKEFEEKVKNKNYFSNEARKQINDEIKWQERQIKQNYEEIECIKKLTEEDFINFYKNLKFNSSSHLKPYKQ